MKLIASIVAAATLACTLVAMALPASGQPTLQRSTAVVAPMKAPQVAPPAQSSEPERPPEVRFIWGGHLPGSEGVVESIGTKYTMFGADSTPQRATVTGLEKEKNRTPPPDEDDD